MTLKPWALSAFPGIDENMSRRLNPSIILGTDSGSSTILLKNFPLNALPRVSAYAAGIPTAKHIAIGHAAPNHLLFNYNIAVFCPDIMCFLCVKIIKECFK